MPTAKELSGSNASAHPSTTLSISTSLAALFRNAHSESLGLTISRNQVLLKLTSAVVTSTEDGAEVELNVKRFLKLRGPPAAAEGSEGDTLESPNLETHARPQSSYSHSQDYPEFARYEDRPEISQIQAEIEVQKGDIERLDNAGYQIVAAIDAAVSRIEREVNLLKDSMHGLKKDIGGNQDDLASLKADVKEVRQLAQDTANVDRLEAQVHSATKVLSEIRRDLGNTTSQLRKDISAVKSDVHQAKRDIDFFGSVVRGGITASKDHANEIASLRNEIGQLRQQMEEERSNTSKAASRTFPGRELDILTSNIAKIGNRASQVETLQMEFEIMKGRV